MGPIPRVHFNPPHDSDTATTATAAVPSQETTSRETTQSVADRTRGAAGRGRGRGSTTSAKHKSAVALSRVSVISRFIVSSTTASCSYRIGPRCLRRLLEASCFPDIRRLLFGTPLSLICSSHYRVFTVAVIVCSVLHRFVFFNRELRFPNVLLPSGIQFFFRLNLGFVHFLCVGLRQEHFRAARSIRGWCFLCSSRSLASSG